jgi:hypothetical protein
MANRYRVRASWTETQSRECTQDFVVIAENEEEAKKSAEAQIEDGAGSEANRNNWKWDEVDAEVTYGATLDTENVSE